jgi:hypothetical protein
MFEAQCLVMRVGGIDGSNDNSPLMADILPCDTSTLVGAFTVSEAYMSCTERFFLTCETPSAIEDEIRLIIIRHAVDVKSFIACERLYLVGTVLVYTITAA